MSVQRWLLILGVGGLVVTVMGAATAYGALVVSALGQLAVSPA